MPEKSKAKQKLIDAALNLLKEKPPSQLNYREIASGAGLSHMTAYRHFKTIEELLEFVAIEGYEKLSESLNYLVQKYESDPQILLEKTVHSYFRFAQNFPYHLTAMFDRGDQKGHFEKREFMRSVEELHREYLRVIEVCQDSDLLPQTMKPEDLGLLLWSFTHGYASLETKSELNLTMAGRTQGEAFIKMMVAVLVQGLRTKSE